MDKEVAMDISSPSRRSASREPEPAAPTVHEEPAEDESIEPTSRDEVPDVAGGEQAPDSQQQVADSVSVKSLADTEEAQDEHDAAMTCPDQIA